MLSSQDCLTPGGVVCIFLRNKKFINFLLPGLEKKEKCGIISIVSTQVFRVLTILIYVIYFHGG